MNMNVKNWLIRLMKSSPQYYAEQDNLKEELLLIDTPLYEEPKTGFVYESVGVNTSNLEIGMTDNSDAWMRGYVPQLTANAELCESTADMSQEKVAV